MGLNCGVIVQVFLSFARFVDFLWDWHNTGFLGIGLIAALDWLYGGIGWLVGLL